MPRNPDQFKLTADFVCPHCGSTNDKAPVNHENNLGVTADSCDICGPHIEASIDVSCSGCGRSVELILRDDNHS